MTKTATPLRDRAGLPAASTVPAVRRAEVADLAARKAEFEAQCARVRP